MFKTLYNNWDNRYREIPRDIHPDAFVDQRRSIWQVSRNHLWLDLVEVAIGQPEFDLYEIEWRNELERQEKRVREQLVGDKERRQWLTDFDSRAERFWQRGFRGRGDAGGVLDYFKIRREPNEIGTRARNIRARIEADLLFGFEHMDPEYALHHLPGAMEFLKFRIGEDRKFFGLQAGEEGAVKRIREADRKREEIRPLFDKCGKWAKGKQERLFSEYRLATNQFYYWQTILQAAQYGHEFCARLEDELEELKKQITICDTRLKLIAKNFDTEISVRIRQSENKSSRDEVVYLVDTQYVNDAINNRFESNKSVQDLHVHTTMEAIRQLRRDRIEFAAYNEAMPVDDGTNRVGGELVDVLRKVSEQDAIEAHRKIHENDKDFEGILGQNIVRKLYGDYGGQVDGKLEQWLRELMGKSMPMVAFHPNTEPMDLPTQGPVLRRCVFLPRCARVAAFEQGLHAKIESITGNQGNWNAIETACKAVPEDRNPTEITILSVAFFFPARHTRVTHALHTMYRNRLQQAVDQEKARSYFEIHTESHNPPLPDLMKLDRRATLAEHLPSVILAVALGLLRVPEKDGEPILFGQVDDFGRVKDKIESGMTMRQDIRETATASRDRFGHDIPVATIILHSLYFEQGNEGCLPALERLVKDRMADTTAPVPLEAVLGTIDTVSGHSFVLSGKKEGDAMYQLMDAKAREAVGLARQLADRSRL